MLQIHDQSAAEVSSWPSQELLKRLQKPQRHRLLHGYPLAAAMPRIPDEVRNAGSAFRFDPDNGRSLLVGVLPHSFCNPKVPGCGFCTFPHESYSNVRAAVVVNHVIAEIGQRVVRDPALRGRKVSGLYLGGGTANLTPAVVTANWQHYSIRWRAVSP